MFLLVHMDQGTKSIYRPRRPSRTALHLAVRENLVLFLETYDERFLDQHGPLTARACRTLEGYLRCGVLSAGFARVRCGTCGHELLVAFSCQLRGVCPSCQQKRAEILCRSVIDEIISGAGPGAVYGPHVRGWNYDGAAVSRLLTFKAFPGYRFGTGPSAGRF